MKKRTVAFSKHAVNVFFHILTGCNLRCRHCYINPGQHGENRVPIAVIERWLAAFSEKAGVANVIFLGGEPTLHPHLPAAVKRAKALGYQSVTIDTNGYLFHDILEKVTPLEVDFFSFSIDGATRETNDTIRGEGVYDVCLANIEKTRRRGFQVSVIYTVSAANIHELGQMAPLLASLGIDRFFIQVIGIRGQSAGRDHLLQVPREQWLAVVPAAAERIAELGITVSYPKVFLAPDEPFACAGLCAENYFIFPNGRVYRCPLCEDFPYHSLTFENDLLVPAPRLNEADFFTLSIPEGCVMNRLIQPDNLAYGEDGRPLFRVACCMLKEEILTG